MHRLQRAFRLPAYLNESGAGHDGGFTLIEVMATIACITALAIIAAPNIQGYMRQVRLRNARPYLEEVAEKQRLYKIVTGKYCCTTYNKYDEGNLSASLGLSLSDAGDFCLVFICNSSTLCETPQTATSFIVPADPGTPTPDFEVWAILRPPSATGKAPAPVQGPGSLSCTPVPTKAAPTGWTYPSTATGSAGKAGQVVVLRYPPPANGISASSGNYHAVQFTWTNGISLSDATSP